MERRAAECVYGGGGGVSREKEERKETGGVKKRERRSCEGKVGPLKEDAADVHSRLTLL